MWLQTPALRPGPHPGYARLLRAHGLRDAARPRQGGGMDTEPPPWTTTHSEILLEDRWIRLRADRLRTQQGVEIAPWYVLDYPDWCVVVALTEDQRLVLVRQWRHGAQSWSLELPGGVIDRTDRDPVAAAQRELQEETGYGGFCAFGVARGYKVDIDPEAWHIRDGVLYLNYDREVQRQWQRDIPGNIARAEANWPRLAER
jgi:8-oxo-dGTP pyrophosphatase MutT (NUDIX family)